MKRQILSFLGFGLIFMTLIPSHPAVGQRRRVVVRRPATVHRPVRRTKLVVHARHPVRRALPATVVVRPARRTVVVSAPRVFLPSVAWTPASVSLPARDRLVWQDSESIAEDEGWVDANFGVDERGNALFLQIDGRAKLNLAEVTFSNGNVQVVDFNERAHGDGVYRLLDFADGRHVATVRLLAMSESDETKLSVYLSKQ